MKSKIFLFRHGQTDWNLAGRFQGHTDIPLNKTGIKEAEELKLYIDQITPEYMVSSDLKRALTTADIVNSSLNLKIEVNGALRETNLGRAEGLFHVDVAEAFGVDAIESWNSIEANTLDFGFPGGESKRDVVTRVMSYLESVVIDNSIYRLAVSTHGGVIKRVCHFITEIPNENLPIKNCCLYELEFSHENRSWGFVAQRK
jgi:broad specificity phosphatase PhoE